MSYSPRGCRLLILVVVLGLVSGCGRKSRHAAPGGSRSLLDLDHRFHIAWPGQGWTVLDEAGARQISARALAGVRAGASMTGLVFVDSAPGVDPDAYARHAVGKLALDDVEVESVSSRFMLGRHASRVVLTGRLHGVSVRYVLHFLRYHGHIYQLVGWGPTTAVSPDGPELEPFFTAFSLTDGVPRVRAEVATGEASGPGWRIRSGELVSAAARVRIRPPAGWRVVAGEELRTMSDLAEVALVARDPAVQIVLFTDRSHGAGAALPAETMKSLGPVTEAAPVDMTLAGETHGFRTLHATELGWEVLYTAFQRHGLRYQILAWYAQEQAGSARAGVAEALAAIEILGDEAQAEARALLEDQPDRQSVVSASGAFRRGVYREFRGRWAWHRPAGIWRINAAEMAAGSDGTLVAEAPAAGLYLTASTLPMGVQGLAALGELTLRILSGMGVEVTRSAPATLVGEPALLFEGHRAREGGAVAYRVHVAQHGDIGLLVLAWAHAGGMEALADEVAAAVDGFRFAPTLEPVEVSGGTYRDGRMGFSFAIDDDAWIRDSALPAVYEDRGSVVSWQQGERSLTVLSMWLAALDLPDGDSLRFLEDVVLMHLDQLTRAEPSPRDAALAGAPLRIALAREPLRSAVIIAGEPGVHLSWRNGRERVDVFVVRRDRTLLAILGAGLSRQELAGLPARLGFLD